MGWRLFRRLKIAPGVRINLSRSGPSLSIGPRGFAKTFSKRGVRTTIGLPGTGVFHTEIAPWEQAGDVRRRCRACGQVVGKTAGFCAHCGAQL